jgi:hypothetical protein
MSAYLFAHFTGEQKDGEQIYFSCSKDGLFWQDLNKGKPVLKTTVGEAGARDPFLVKHPHTGTYYLIATDLRIEAGKGWGVAQYAGSKNLLVWQSADLVHWSDVRLCEVGVEGAGCVWAPEAIYVEEKNAFFVFWASMIQLPQDAEPKQRIYGAYTADFQEFSQPVIFAEKKNHLIDSTMVECDGYYYRFSKDETTKCILLERGKTLAADGFTAVDAPVLASTFGVEGPEVYQLADGTWCLIVDQFATDGGYVPFICKDLASGEFTKLTPDAYHMGATKKRHGGVIAISDTEYERLMQAFS